MEKSLFLGFDEINSGKKQKAVVNKIRNQLLEELDVDRYQLSIALGIESQNDDDINQAILFKKQLFDILHSNTTLEQQKGIIMNNAKHVLLYQCYITTVEADIDNRLSNMKCEITESGTTKEEMKYMISILKKAQGCFYDTFQQNEKFGDIIQKINQQQDECSSDTISDFMHMTRNRIVHKVYKSEGEGMDIVNKIIQHMNPQEMEYILERLREKNMSMFVGLTEFDKYIHKTVKEKFLSYNTHQ